MKNKFQKRRPTKNGVTDFALSIPSTFVTAAPSCPIAILPLLAGSVASALAIAAFAATSTHVPKRAKKGKTEQSVAEPK
jgi:hypothetical protein